jgi:hypothetical protein
MVENLHLNQALPSPRQKTERQNKQHKHLRSAGRRMTERTPYGYKPEPGLWQMVNLQFIPWWPDPKMQKKTGRVDLDSWRLLCSSSQRDDNGDCACDANIDVEEEEGRGWVCLALRWRFPSSSGGVGVGARREAAAATEPYARVRWEEVGAVASYFLGVSESVFPLIGVIQG